MSPWTAVLTLERRTDTTHNDICLAIVTGALRELVAERGESDLTMKAMIPVSRRLPEAEGSLGNRISFGRAAPARPRSRSIRGPMTYVQPSPVSRRPRAPPA